MVSKPIPSRGLGLVVQSVQFDRAVLDSMGIAWVRSETTYDEAHVRAMLDHYFGLPQLFTVKVGSDPDLIAELYRWGVRDVCTNEPNLAKYTPDSQPWDALRVAGWFSLCQQAAPKMRLYGPGISRFDDAYMEDFTRWAPHVRPEFHGYGLTPQQADEAYTRFGAICGEVAGAMSDDPVTFWRGMTPVAEKHAMCLYAGASSDPNDQNRMLFSLTPAHTWTPTTLGLALVSGMVKP